MKTVAVLGASGRMGREVIGVLQEKKLHTIALSQNRNNNRKLAASADVVIDFSTPEGLESGLELALFLKCPIVSGTTGILASHEKQLATAAKTVPVLWAPNMSIGIAALKRALSALAGLEGFDFQIEEFHHRMKKDHPSGTAKSLQQTLHKVLSPAQQKNLAQPVSIRAGGIFGIHRVYAVSMDESLCFEHQALNRRVFAAGAVTAANWLLRQKKGLYTIQDILQP